MIRGAGCGSPARPDLWEAGESDLPGPPDILRLTGTTTWLAYSFSSAADSIWMGKPWKVIAKEFVDGFLYAVVTAATFAWLWSGAE